jgi:DNA-binding CsgD family transcriptional regulator
VSLAPEQPSVGRQSVPLIQREQEVALLVAQELTNCQVAAKLVISEHVAAIHVYKILK